MVITEIFPNPTVKQVVFEIRFPNLFFIEEKISKLQFKVMEKFPDSALIFERQFLIVNKGPNGKLEKLPSQIDEDFAKKIWQFKSEKNYLFNVTSNNLNIVSKFHKTYNLEGGNKFRDVIEFVLSNFLEVVPISTLKRLGLRYIDECPLPRKDNSTFKSYYKSVLPVKRFNIADAQEMFFRTKTKRGDFNITYMEELRKIGDGYKLILDFDGFATKIPAKDYLKVTDELHKIISKEYEKTIKAPVYEYMRQRSE